MTETPTKDATKPHKLPSGAVLHLGRPPYKACADLRNALARAAGARPLTPEEMKIGFDTLKEDPSAGGALVSRLLNVLASEQVEASLFACLTQATYEPKDCAVQVKVTPALLDHADFGDDARKDLYNIFLAVGGAAVGPFLGPLISAYMDFLKKGAAARVLKSKSAPIES